MKKILSVGLSVLVLLSFAACDIEKAVIEDDNKKVKAAVLRLLLPS